MLRRFLFWHSFIDNESRVVKRNSTLLIRTQLLIGFYPYVDIVGESPGDDVMIRHKHSKCRRLDKDDECKVARLATHTPLCLLDSLPNSIRRLKIFRSLLAWRHEVSTHRQHWGKYKKFLIQMRFRVKKTTAATVCCVSVPRLSECRAFNCIGRLWPYNVYAINRH